MCAGACGSSPSVDSRFEDCPDCLSEGRASLIAARSLARHRERDALLPLALGIEVRAPGEVQVEAVDVERQRHIIGVVLHTMNRVRQHHHDFAWTDNVLADFPKLGVAGPRAVVGARPDDIAFAAPDTGDDGPGAVVVGRHTSSGAHAATKTISEWSGSSWRTWMPKPWLV